MPTTNDYNLKLAAEARERRERIVKLLEAGVSRREVCELYGISKQRLSALLKQARREGLINDV